MLPRSVSVSVSEEGRTILHSPPTPVHSRICRRCHSALHQRRPGAALAPPHEARLVAGLRRATDQGASRGFLQHAVSDGFRFPQSISVLSRLRRVHEPFVPVRHLAHQGEKQRLAFQQGAELRKAHVPPQRGGCIRLRGIPRRVPVRVVTRKEPLFAERHPDQWLSIFPVQCSPPAPKRVGAAPYRTPGEVSSFPFLAC